MSASMASVGVPPGRSRLAAPSASRTTVEFDTHPARPAVEHDPDAPVELRQDMLGAGGADASEAVGAGGRDGHAGSLQQRVRHGVIGHAQADRLEARGDDARDARSLSQDERQRSGPAGGRQDGHSGIVGIGRLCVTADLACVREMDDERVEGRAFLGCEDAGDGLGIEGIRPQPVDGLGREGDELAGPDGGRCLADRGWVVAGEDARMHHGRHSGSARRGSGHAADDGR